MLGDAYQAERGVLGAVIIKNAALDQVRSALEPHQFEHYRHRHIYRAMLALSDKERPIDLITLTEQMKENQTLEESGGASYLLDMHEEVPTAANVKAYIQLVVQDEAKR